MAILEVAPGRIVSNPDFLGGRPRIADTRIGVHHIVVWHEQLGMSPDDIASEYELSLGDVHAALAYYYSHQSEINADLRAEAALIDQMQQLYPSVLQEKLRARRDR
jgi:uncharacterized protein (DUF433 family)